MLPNTTVNKKLHCEQEASNCQQKSRIHDQVSTFLITLTLTLLILRIRSVTWINTIVYRMLPSILARMHVLIKVREGCVCVCVYTGCWLGLGTRRKFWFLIQVKFGAHRLLGLGTGFKCLYAITNSIFWVIFVMSRRDLVPIPSQHFLLG